MRSVDDAIGFLAQDPMHATAAYVAPSMHGSTVGSVTGYCRHRHALFTSGWAAAYRVVRYGQKREEMNGIIDDKPLTLNYCYYYCLDYDEAQLPFPNLELYCVASTNGLRVRYHLSFGQN